MRTTLISLVAAAALALPAAAFAHGGHHGGWHRGWTQASAGFFAAKDKDSHSASGFTKLTGAGSTFGAATSTVSGTVAPSGTFSATLTTNWSTAMSKTFTLGTVSCASATASLTLSGSTTPDSFTGKTCSWTPAGGTAVYGFFGTDSNGMRLVLKQAPSGAVAGVAFGGAVEPMMGAKLFSKSTAHAMEGCGH
jgi:hypothetical protein